MQHHADMQEFTSRNDIGLQAISDILRLKLLANHGGVWADATLFCTAPLENWLPKYFQDDFFAFESIKPDRWMTSWFLVGKPESKILQSWLRAMQDYWSNTQFKKTTYWKKQCVRRITSLRRRSILSNDVWFSSVFSRFLKVYPYPISMYLFERALKADGLDTLWKNRVQFSDEQPEYLQNVLKLQNSVSPESMAFIQSNKTPMHKLNWRLGESLSNTQSNLHYLLANAEPK